jgi:hypothetical protein
MVTRKGVPISSYDFSIRPGEPDVAKFAKLICNGLQRIGLPGWACLYPPFCKTDVSIYSKWHGAEVPMFSSVHGGPSICMPSSKLIHIHWVQNKKVIVGFEWRLSKDEIGPSEQRKWDALKAALEVKLPHVKYRKDSTGGDSWPFRWQYVYQIDPSKFKELLSRLQNDTEERHIMIDGTKQALTIAGEVFSW